MLAWLRRTNELPTAEAAAALGVQPEELGSVEQAGVIITADLLGTLARVYEVDESTLLLPEPPGEAVPLPSFRGRSRVRRPSEETRRAVRFTRRFQTAISELRDDDPEVLPGTALVAATLQDDPYGRGEENRAVLGVSFHRQIEWASERPTRLFGHWRRAVQRTGVLVLLRRMEWEDCRGFSLSYDDLVPTILVNSGDTDRGRVFTLCHELGHIALRIPGVCDVSPEGDRFDVERWCNRFAASLLMPAPEVHRELQARRYARLPDEGWTQARVDRMASAIGVSAYALAWRLKELGVTRFIDRERDKLFRRERRRSKILHEDRDQAVRTPRPGQRLYEVGAGTLAPVLDALATGLLTKSELAEMLDVRTDQVEDLKRRVREEQASYGAR